MTHPLILVPVKRLTLAKSRVAVTSRRRQMVALRLVEHTLRTVAACVGGDSMVVVTADPSVRRLTVGLGGRVICDTHLDLNSALDHALRELSGSDPLRAVLVLVSDLPRLNQDDLAEVVHHVSRAASPQHVADLTECGTTAVSIRPGQQSPMLFGPQSAQRFLAAGWESLRHAPVSVRADLDTIQDLHELGLPAERLLEGTTKGKI